MNIKSHKVRRILIAVDVLLLIALLIYQIVLQKQRQDRKQELLQNSPAHLVTTAAEIPADCTAVHIVPKSEENGWIERLPYCREGLYILTCDAKHIDTTIAEVAACTQIERLTVSNIQLKNLDAISKMPNLLEFWYNPEHNPLPENALTFSGDFPALTTLTLRNIPACDLSAFGRITTLESMDASNLTQLSDISWMASLTNLTELNLSHSAVEDISVLANCKQLRKLYLDSTNVCDITALSDLMQLEEFTAMQNYIHDGSPRIVDVTPLANKPHLRVIDLYGADVADITPLSNLPALEKLELAYTKVTNLDPVFTMPSIKELSFYDTGATCKNPDILWAFIESHNDKTDSSDVNSSDS